MIRSLFAFIFKSLGWSIQGSFDDMPLKYIIIVAPHTSNWDFPLGMLVRSVVQISETKFLGKSQLFKFPYGFIFRAMGGYPVVRTKDNNLVDSVVKIFNSKEKFSISLAPEGTRSKVKRIKTGFYHIAKKAGIPIYLVGFDYSIKKVFIKEAFYPTENTIADFKYIIQFFTSVKGKRPELGIDMSLFDSLKSDMESKK